MQKLLLVIAIMACSATSHAEQAVDTSGNNTRYDEFYTVSDQGNLLSQKSQAEAALNPLEAAKVLFSNNGWVEELSAQVISLLKFDHHNEQFGNLGESYNRKKHFGGWINDSSDNTCLNTRGKVLVRDSKVEVTLTSGGCAVSSGEWDEPYTGSVVHQASEIQIDHFVPLKNAYVSGAWKWNFAKRCLYANYMGNDFHLISADGHENMSKSDSSPEGYMPPNQGYKCQYLAQWLKVKLIWNLGLTPPEKSTVETLIQQNNCDLAMFNYSAAELQGQRKFMMDHANLCQ